MISLPEQCQAFNSFARFPTDLKHLDWGKGERLLLAKPLEILPFGSFPAKSREIRSARGGGDWLSRLCDVMHQCIKKPYQLL